MSDQKNYHRMFEDILVLLCWNDKATPLLIHSLKMEYFGDPVYRDIAKIASDYYLSYKKVVKEDLYTLVEERTKGKDFKIIDRYFQVVANIWDSRFADNMEYTLNRLDEFIATQSVEIILRKSAALLEAGKAGNVNNTEEIQKLFRDSQKQRTSLFDPGIRVTDVNAVLESMKKTGLYVATGIPELDKLGICPTPGEMMVVTAPTGRGKTWFAGSLLKHAYLAFKPDGSRYKTCHISLEMDRGRTIQRYWQSFFAISKKSDPQFIRYFGENRLDRTDGVLKEIRPPREITPKLTFNDINLEKELRKRVSMLKHDNLIIKDFPMGQLTMNELYAYLDSLETFLNFKPDILVVDYPDLMKLPSDDNRRLAIGGIYESLHGLAQERKIAIIAPCQVNRAGDDTEHLITRKYIGEDYSKIQKCDVHITYNQTPVERGQGLARLYVDKNRNGETGDIILISQNYAIGQFCVDSRPFNKKYNPATGELDNQINDQE